MPTDALTIDQSGMVQAPRLGYTVFQTAIDQIRPAWPSVDALKASLTTAPAPGGLPEWAPNPNDLYLHQGVLTRLVVDAREQRIPYVTADGQVVEDIKFTRRPVALSMDEARRASDGGVPTDFWNGFTWLRSGYSPERDFPTMAQALEIAAENEALVFSQPLPDNDIAVVRHQINRINQQRPPSPVRGKRGRPKSQPAGDADGASESED